MPDRHDERLSDLVFLAGSANLPLAQSIADEIGLPLWPVDTLRFPDGEAQVRIGASVRGRDAYLVQPTSPPVDEHLMELLLLADACRRAGAASVTAVIPYFGYARQDRRAGGREAIGGRVVADLLAAVRVDRVLALDLHSPAIEGFLPMPLEHLSAVPLLATALQREPEPDTVVVAPDLGAVKLAERYAEILEAPVAVIQKTRLGPEKVQATAVIGDVRAKSPIVVDDMISTGGTIEAAVKALQEAGARDDFTVVATHGLFVADCLERFASLPIARLLVTDSVPLVANAPQVERITLAPLIAEAVLRVHKGQPISGLSRWGP